MRSHLDDGNNERTNVVRLGEAEMRPEGMHGAPVVDPSVYTRRKPGGDLGDIYGADDPRGKHQNIEAVPENWGRGSTTRFAHSELPASDIGGNGFYGSASQFSAAELDRIDRANGTYDGSPLPPQPAQRQMQPPVQQQRLAPGAYKLPDGRVLLVNSQGQQTPVTPQQYQALLAQRQQQMALQQQQQMTQQPAKPSLMGSILSILKKQ